MIHLSTYNGPNIDNTPCPAPIYDWSPVDEEGMWLLVEELQNNPKVSSRDYFIVARAAHTSVDEFNSAFPYYENYYNQAIQIN